MSEVNRNSTRARRITFDTHRKFDPAILGGRAHMICRCGRETRPDCGAIIDPAKDDWRAHHNIPWAEGGQDTPENLFPILTSCDVEFTARRDTARIAKNKRIYEKRQGIKKTSRPMPGSRNHPSKLRKRMDGTVTKW